MPVRIVVDEREKNSVIPNLLRHTGAIIDFAQLKVGDYIVSPETAIERKTIHDLINSIYDGRLFVQCSELAQYYSKPVVIIEGNIIDLIDDIPAEIDNDKLRILEERIPLAYDALATVALRFRIPIVHTPSAEYTAQLLVIMVNKSLEGETSNNLPLLKRIKKKNPEYTQQLSILASLPGIGDKLAIRMLSKFQTPRRALNASVAELARIPGFGIARARRVRKILDYPYNERIESIQRSLLDNDLNDFNGYM
ncbi:MAG TPA: ERCC4 domain-containing protein [Nitrososphaeraceae archaeon]|nr:ERCC4 domain-containing protein [Nitrososphaeraceae archaeon]